MMLVDRLQVSAEERSKCYSMEEDGPFNNKHGVLKGPTVTQPIMNVRWKMGDWERLGNWKATRLGGARRVGSSSLNIWK